MNIITKTITLVGLLFICGQAAATITSAQGAPTQTSLSATTNNNFNVIWTVNVTTNHFEGVMSSYSEIVGTGIVYRTSLGDAGAGPFAFTEAFAISASQVNSWINAGRSQIIIRRVFSATNPQTGSGSSATAQAVLNLTPASTGSGSTTTTTRGSTTTTAPIAQPNQLGTLSSRRTVSGFAIHRLQIRLPNQTGIAVIEQNSPLQVKLDVSYSGRGFLEGKWQIAMPGTTDGQPLYQTVALVRENLTNVQYSELLSPALPTSVLGKYLLRFCVTNANGQVIQECLTAGQVAHASYQIIEPQIELPLITASLQSPSRMNDASGVNWQPVDNAVVYQLQIFANTASGSPTFITGILLPSSSTSTAITPIAANRLIQNKPYVLRINALDSSGRLIAQSTNLGFFYSP